ncbi:MAG: hypothetical protein ACYSUD_22645, partial [Planctomycetota bacterium]
AEAADTIGSSWRTYDDPAASGGKSIGSDDGDGNDNDFVPGAEWVATYSFNVPAGGEYKILLRGQEAGADSFWVRIPNAIRQTHEDPDQPGAGWFTATTTVRRSRIGCCRAGTIRWKSPNAKTACCLTLS